MPKNIVFCSDGTWDGAENSPDTPASNVLKLFNSLAGDLTVGTSVSAEQERTFSEAYTIRQIAKYLHGVGDSGGWLDQKLGGSLGAGLVARVLRGYTFISRNYGAGDSIVIAGFSRGAYTARALAGFITTMGLLDYASLGLDFGGPDAKAYQFAAAAWYQYQQQRRKTEGNPFWLAKLEAFVSGVPELGPALVLTPRYIPNVRIAAVGVWDTVGALGIPELSEDHGTRLDLLRFADTSLSPLVGRGFHAISADEQRVDFSPTLWDPDPARITQCLFPGAHSDVGGGYPEGAESSLSNVSMAWMAMQLNSCGLNFRAMPTAANGSEVGPMHMPWTSADFLARPTAVRQFPVLQGDNVDIVVHPALRNRLGKVVAAIAATVPPATRSAPYLPVALLNAGYLDVSGVKIRG
jgi:uncharacterized protein (DUF2235 family)